jgi:hypothetical protein
MMTTETLMLQASKARRFGGLAILLGLGLMVGEASATLLCRNNPNNQGDFAAPFPTLFVDLDRAAGFQGTVSFSTSVANQGVRVIFNASASIGGSATTFLSPGISINPAGAPAEFFCPPTDFISPFVSGNGTASESDGAVSAVKQCFARIPTVGVHTIRVRLEPRPAPGAAWLLSGLSLCIDTQ